MSRKRITIKDRVTKWGWEVKTMSDLVCALMGYPYFQSVAIGFVEEAVSNAIKDRSEWNSVEEMGLYIAENYI